MKIGRTCEGVGIFRLQRRRIRQRRRSWSGVGSRVQVENIASARWRGATRPTAHLRYCDIERATVTCGSPVHARTPGQKDKEKTSMVQFPFSFIISLSIPFFMHFSSLKCTAIQCRY